MAFSYQRETAKAGQTDFTVRFEFFDRQDVRLFVNGTLNDKFYWISDYSIRMDTPFNGGEQIRIQRITDMERLRVIFHEGAPFLRENLDEVHTQLLYIIQESSEGTNLEGFYNDIDMHGNRITNLGNPIDDTDAANKKTVVDTENKLIGITTALDARISGIESAPSGDSAVRPWVYVAKGGETSLNPNMKFSRCLLFVNGVTQYYGVSYSVQKNVIKLTKPVQKDDVIMALCGEYPQGPHGEDYLELIAEINRVLQAAEAARDTAKASAASAADDAALAKGYAERAEAVSVELDAIITEMNKLAEEKVLEIDAAGQAKLVELGELADTKILEMEKLAAEAKSYAERAEAVDLEVDALLGSMSESLAAAKAAAGVATAKAAEASASATSASTSEKNAKASASGAANSAATATAASTAAAKSEAAAKTSATDADVRAKAAKASQDAAEASKKAALASKDAAAKSATAASTSSTEANAAATAAKASETKSTTEANRAKTEADRAEQAADDAVSGGIKPSDLTQTITADKLKAPSNFAADTALKEQDPRQWGFGATKLPLMTTEMLEGMAPTGVYRITGKPTSGGEEYPFSFGVIFHASYMGTTDRQVSLAIEHSSSQVFVRGTGRRREWHELYSTNNTSIDPNGVLTTKQATVTLTTNDLAKESGNSHSKVMTQKAVSDKLAELEELIKQMHQVQPPELYTATAGQTEIAATSTDKIFKVYVNGLIQYPTISFTFDVERRMFVFTEPLAEGDRVMIEYCDIQVG